MRPSAAICVTSMAVLLILLVGSAAEGPAAAQAASVAIVVDFDIQVDAGAADYIKKAAERAISDREDLLITMDTPGGLLGDMQQIVGSIEEIQAEGLRVYTFVPAGGAAASAGSYIALATNGIYMANGSFIGPSTPYVVGGSPSQEEHVRNAMVAYIRALAETNGYNVTAAASMAESNVAYTAQEAAAIGLISGLADTFSVFLAKIGMSGAALTYFDEPLYDQFLSFVSHPLVDGLFILLGILALVIDLLHQSVVLTVVGVILIALGFLGAQVIGAPVVAFVILVVAAALIIIEIKAGHGLFAIAGVLLGLVGTWMLAYGTSYSPSPFGLGTYVLMGVIGALAAIGFLYLMKIRMALMRQPKLVDPARVVGMSGRAVTDIAPGHDGVCNVAAEDWTCTAEVPIEKGALVRVREYRDGKILVEKVPADS